MYYKTKRKTTNTTINFILLAYFIPLLCSILLLNIPIFKTGIGNLLLFAIQGASPSLAALLSVYIGENKTGITTFLYKKYIENFSIYYCLLAFFTPALILTISKLVINAVMGYSWSISLPSKRKIIIILWALIAEELGWRGFLQEKFEVKFGKHLTPLLVGTIWALWHYHFFIIGSMEVPYIAFALNCIIESYGYYVITKMSKGNIVPGSIWHFSGNYFFNLYLINPNWNNGSIVPYHITNTVYIVYIIIFILYNRLLNFKISNLNKKIPL